ncbi:hypothetical protein RIVM261_002560 [Rivularia sp. IAM M-261]|nr:hypothetical protein RIVM261_002560 [Rivularia sp. IAM M-261]
MYRYSKKNNNHQTTIMATKIVELGSIGGLPEFRVVMNDGNILPMPVVETRKTTLIASVVIERTENINEEVLKAFIQSIMMAGASVLLAGCLPGGVIAMPLFLRTFGAYAASKGIELTVGQIKLNTETVYGEWENFKFA